MHNIEKSDDLLIVDDAYIAKIRADNEERVQEAIAIQREQIRMKRNVPQGMVGFIRECIWSGKEFTLKDVCEECNLSYEKNYNKVYSVILKWRTAAKNGFKNPETITILDEYDTEEDKWDAFIDRLNADDIFLLYKDRYSKKKSVYFQPSWAEKEVLDYFRMNKHFRGQITVLKEMTRYGEDFADDSGILISPGELRLEMEGVMTKATQKVDVLVGNKIKELETSSDQ